MNGRDVFFDFGKACIAIKEIVVSQVVIDLGNFANNHRALALFAIETMHKCSWQGDTLTRFKHNLATCWQDIELAIRAHANVIVVSIEGIKVRISCLFTDQNLHLPQRKAFPAF